MLHSLLILDEISVIKFRRAYEWDYQKKTDDMLIHYGVKGMKWGVRRYQNKDGSLTTMGRKRLKSESSNRKSNSSKKNSSNKLSNFFRKINECSVSDDDLIALSLAGRLMVQSIEQKSLASSMAYANLARFWLNRVG